MLVAVDGVPANAFVELSSPKSYISRRFLGSRYEADTLELRCRLFSSGEVDIPFFSDMNLVVVDSLSHDVVLGRDWHAHKQDKDAESRSLLSNDIPIHSDANGSLAAAYPVPFTPSSERGVDSSGSKIGSSQDAYMSYLTAKKGRESADVSNVQTGYYIMHANFFGNIHNYSDDKIIQTSIFYSSLEAIQRLMSMHKVKASDDLVVSRRRLIMHLASGECVSESGTACHLVNVGFASAHELTIRILRDLGETKVAKAWPTGHLRIVAEALHIACPKDNVRRFIQKQLTDRRCMLERVVASPPELLDILHSFERHSRSKLLSACNQHRIPVESSAGNETLRCSIINHLAEGRCKWSDGAECASLRSEWLASACGDDWMYFFLVRLVEKQISLRPLQRILTACNIPFGCEESLSQLRSTLRTYIRAMAKGKMAGTKVFRELSDNVDTQQFSDSESWPSVPSRSLKNRLVRMFAEETSTAKLSTVVCASCSESVLKADVTEVNSSELEFELLKRADLDHRISDSESEPWLDSDPTYHPPMPLSNTAFHAFDEYMLDPLGVIGVQDGCIRVQLCDSCMSSLKANSVPPLALANRTFLGPVPDELKNLTVIEEAMIARCRAKCWIIQLKEENSNLELPNSQRGVKGHIIVYPQNTSAIANLLPPSIEEITSPICVLFVGSHPPSPEWLKNKAKPLAVRPAVVRKALIWLKQHNPLYKDISINESVLNQLNDTHILPFSVQHIHPTVASESQTSRYDASNPPIVGNAVEQSLPWQNVVITNVECSASANSLRSAALRHVKEKNGGYIQIPHDQSPVNEFVDPALFPMIYPTLFPYGIGGFRDHERESSLSMQRHVRHLFNLRDRRFQEHYSFLFTAFNMLQRHSVLLHTKLKTQKSNFDKLADSISQIDATTVHSVIEWMGRGEQASATWSKDELKLFTLMREVTAVTSNIPGSASARTTMRNEIRALMVDKGLPNFYLTINPADVYNPVVNFLTGAEIDLDRLLDSDIVDYWNQSILVAKNPAIAAKFFNIYMKAFISSLLRYDPTRNDKEGGVLGVVKAYYGCVEAQGRGMLHCHMLVWIEGGLNPNELKEKMLSDGDFANRLLAYLDDTISNSIPDIPSGEVSVPSDTHHPCSVQSVIAEQETCSDEVSARRQKDISNVVRQCQRHTHSHTCYKYFKGLPGELKQCRFDLGEHTVRHESRFDAETGELSLRRLDGLVNNFNVTMIEALRCNMDIQFIGSGASAKAIVYYITDYITKSMLKTHVAYSALELAIKQIGELDPVENNAASRAKKLLRKCAYALLSHQELSAPQVASYLMGFEDHFKSHEFTMLYWPAFEKLIDAEYPSPECRSIKSSGLCKEAAAETVTGTEGASVRDDSTGDDPELEDVEHEPYLLEEEELNDHEVVITVNPDGQLSASTDAVNDYRYRGEVLNNWSLWEFRARVQKVKKTKSQLRVHNVAESSTIAGRKYVFIPLLKSHEQSQTHILRVSPPDMRLIPIPTGPKIPRRDSDDTFPRFCRLMMTLFKPWRCASDLRGDAVDWKAAYENFLVVANPDVSFKINNTQILHECRDSRDSHFEQRRNRGRVPSATSIEENDPCTFGTDTSAESILQHLQQIDACFSERMSAADIKKMECLKSVEASGIFQSATHFPRPLLSEMR